MKNLEFPEFGNDRLSVGGYTTVEFSKNCRLFLPIESPSGTSISWKIAAAHLDVQYSSRQVPTGFFEPLISLLNQSFGASAHFTFIVWCGYADTYNESAPVGFWSAGHGTAIVGPPYMDSYFVSCSAELASKIRSVGYELLSIERDIPLPVWGSGSIARGSID